MLKPRARTAAVPWGQLPQRALPQQSSSRGLPKGSWWDRGGSDVGAAAALRAAAAGE